MNAYLKKSNTGWQKAAIVVAGVGVFMGLLIAFNQPVKNLFYYATSPLTAALSGAGGNTGNFVGLLVNGKGLLQENTNLKEENQKLLSQISTLQENIQTTQTAALVLENT